MFMTGWLLLLLECCSELHPSWIMVSCCRSTYRSSGREQVRAGFADRGGGKFSAGFHVVCRGITIPIWNYKRALYVSDYVRGNEYVNGSLTIFWPIWISVGRGSLVGPLLLLLKKEIVVLRGSGQAKRSSKAMLYLCCCAFWWMIYYCGC